jgi:hypothetical protein
MQHLALLLFISTYGPYYNIEVLDMPISYSCDDCIDFVLIDIEEELN